ncbi:hypothetical protein BJY01DRAFT_203690 [Aspergillus pseudoustus]|uniref:Secreted protein n=1 Tax=Aspergillus pseudoustus TaxID=1810923 RepID=A0ABR4KXR5_9EURO
MTAFRTSCIYTLRFMFLMFIGASSFYHDVCHYAFFAFLKVVRLFSFIVRFQESLFSHVPLIELY